MRFVNLIISGELLKDHKGSGNNLPAVRVTTEIQIRWKIFINNQKVVFVAVTDDLDY